MQRAAEAGIITSVQHVSVSTTPILPTTEGTYHGLNCFGHLKYSPQISIYQNSWLILEKLSIVIFDRPYQIWINLLCIIPRVHNIDSFSLIIHTEILSFSHFPFHKQ